MNAKWLLIVIIGPTMIAWLLDNCRVICPKVKYRPNDKDYGDCHLLVDPGGVDRVWKIF